MTPRFYRFIKAQSYFKPGDRVLIAVSGGVDSMNLLHFLHRHQADFQIELGLAHVNHKQRLQSDQEEDYLREWAEQANLPIYIKEFSGKFSEKKARDFRYTFFEQVMREGNYRTLVTAHHADDQAETVLMRLIRGGQLQHLSGIRAVQPFGPGQLIRPFLTLSKSDLEKLFHFEDTSNQDQTFFRNRVRQTYLPLLSQENPRLKDRLLDLSEDVSHLYQALSDLTRHLDKTSCQVFQAQTDSIQSYLLQDYLTQFPDLQLSRSQFFDLLQMLRRPGNVQNPLKSGYQLIKTYERFWIEKISPQTDSQLQPLVVNYGNIVRIGQYQLAFLDKDQAEGLALTNREPITIRPWQAGDRIQRGNFSKKVSRLFIDDKVPLSSRREALVGQQGQEILFVLSPEKTYLRILAKDDIIEGRLHIQKLEDGGDRC